ncbi:MAG: dihydroorotate dehydrogenase [bacterium]|nr:dihydroorotate dehydrogenase [bacterium]
MNLSTKICKAKLANPTILASGILGVSGASLAMVAKKGAGAVTSKSIGPEERKGHKNPVIIANESYMINAVGLSNAGVAESIDEIEEAVNTAGVPVIGSVIAGKMKEFGPVAKKLSAAKPALIELNISCPNVQDEMGRPFAATPETAAKATRAVKNSTTIPVIVKLSPNVGNLKQIAKAVEDAGADAINMGNTVGPGMAIDLKAVRPILTNKVGGVSGPAIKPIAVRCVYDVYEAVKIPIIGTGGVTYGNDAIEMMMAGASAVGIGTGVYYRGVDVFKKVSDEIEAFMKENGYSNLKQMIGKAH